MSKIRHAPTYLPTVRPSAQRDGTEIAVISHENVSKPSKHHLCSQETLLTIPSNPDNTEIRFSQIDSILKRFVKVLCVNPTILEGGLRDDSRLCCCILIRLIASLNTPEIYMAKFGSETKLGFSRAFLL